MNGGPDVTVPDLLAIAIAVPAPGEIVAQVRGELDMYSAPELDDVLSALLVGLLPRRLVLDLDRAAVPRIVWPRGAGRAAQPDGDGRATDVLRLVGLRPTVTRVLTLTGVLAQFDVHDDVEGALAGVDVPACSGGRLRP